MGVVCCQARRRGQTSQILNEALQGYGSRTCFLIVLCQQFQLNLERAGIVGTFECINKTNQSSYQIGAHSALIQGSEQNSQPFGCIFHHFLLHTLINNNNMITMRNNGLKSREMSCHKRIMYLPCRETSNVSEMCSRHAQSWHCLHHQH